MPRGFASGCSFDENSYETYDIFASSLKNIVAAHELGHIILHRSQLKMAPMKDDVLYNMRDNTEYEANLFAADLILDDC